MNRCYPEYAQRLSMRLDQWLLRHQQELHFKTTWMGIPALTNPLDAWVYQELLAHLRPETVIEIGGSQGGGSLYLAHLLDLIGGGHVISVEIDRSRWIAPDHPRVVKIDGDSGSIETFEHVRANTKGTTVIIHDADHRRDAVRRDLELYAPLVTRGSYFIVEDGIVDLFNPGDAIAAGEQPGPLRAIDEFLAEHPEFEIDPSCERYLLTYNPRGFLKRKEL
jgi:cephalosporin hydroxylase